MSGPPPPPPPGPPPPVVKSAAPQNRGALLNSIEGFSKGKLKKAETNDRSTPITANKRKCHFH